MDKTLIQFSELVNQLTSTMGRIEKENFLKLHKDNDGIKTVLHFLFNPYIITGTSTKKLAKHIKTPMKNPHEKPSKLKNPHEIKDILELINYFTENNTGRDIDVQTLIAFTKNLAPELAELVYGLVKKDLKLGIQEKTLNKVFGSDFIPTMNVMLAESYEDNKKHLDGKEFIITQKMDGVRAVLIFAEGTPSFFTRNGRQITDLVELEVDVLKLNNNFVYDGELVLNTIQDLNAADLYRATVKVTNADTEKRGLTFHIFDRLPKIEFMAGKSTEDTLTRKTALHNELSKINSPILAEVKMLYRGTDTSVILPMLTDMTSKGLEGLMLNIASVPYECKRTKNLLKVKEFHTADVLVLSIEEGTGANKGKLGAVYIKFTGPDKNSYTCKVGSGFSQSQREYFFQNPSEILNKIIEIGYFEISKNQNDTGLSLRFPTFKHLRPDKFEISMH